MFGERRKSQDSRDRGVREGLGAAQPAFGNQLSCHPRYFMMMPCNVISVYILIDPFSKRSAGIAASSVFLANECEGKGNTGRELLVPVRQELGLGLGGVGLKFVLSPAPLPEQGLLPSSAL